MAILAIRRAGILFVALWLGTLIAWLFPDLFLSLPRDRPVLTVSIW